MRYGELEATHELFRGAKLEAALETAERFIVVAKRVQAELQHRNWEYAHTSPFILFAEAKRESMNLSRRLSGLRKNYHALRRERKG